MWYLVVVTLVAALAQVAPSQTELPDHWTFVQNVGQWDDDLLAAAGMRGGAIQVRRDGLWLAWSDAEAPGLVRVGLGTSGLESVTVIGEVVPVNLYGPGALRMEAVPSASTIEAVSVDGTVLRLTTGTNGVGFTLRRGTPIEGVRCTPIALQGVSSTSCSDAGLSCQAGSGSLRLSIRSARIDGNPVAFTVRDTDENPAVDVPGWRGKSPLTLEGDLVWSTFLGGSASDTLTDLEVLEDGTVLLTGGTQSLDFPTTRDAAFPTAGLGLFSAFLSRLSADGASLLYSTYLTHDDSSNALAGRLAVEGTVKAAIIGYTKIVSLPTTPNAMQPAYAGGAYDGFIAEFDLSTGALDYLSYLGASGSDVINRGLYTAAGLIAVAGKSNSADYPVTSAVIQETKSQFFDAVVTLVDTSRAPQDQVVASTFLGGVSAGDEINRIRPGPEGDFVVAGFLSPTYPIPPGGYDPGPWTSPGDAPFVGRISADLTQFTNATLLQTTPLDIALAGLGEVAFCGHGGPSAPPTTPGAYDQSYNGGQTDGYVGVLSPNLDALEWGTYLGGSEHDDPYAIAIDDLGTVIVGGNTRSPDFPTTPGALDGDFSGGIGDPWAAVLTNHGATLSYCTFIGGSTNSAGFIFDVATLGGGDFVVGGKSASADQPSTPGAYDEDWNQIFVSHFAVDITWTSLGSGLAGSSGIPSLTGEGGLTAGETTTLVIQRAKALSSAWLVIGLGKLAAPFKQGVLVPSPDLVLGGIPIDATGKATLSFVWPAGLPAGLATYHQVWISDPAAAAGLSATNGLQALTP